MSKDLTHNLPNDENKAPTTHPMLEAILARINGLAGDLADFRVEVNQKIAALTAELQEFRADTNKNFRGIDRRFDVFSIELTRVKADVLDHENRLEDLERKAS